MAKDAGDGRPGTGAVSATEPDWSREACQGWWDPGRRLLRTIRAHQKLGERRSPLRKLVRGSLVMRHRFWTWVAGVDIPLDSRIAGGLLLPHPNGIVLHPDAKVGPNCLIFQQVTLGTREGREGAPVIGGHVDIGAGAKILGPVTVGDHARIGANAVVLDDVPAGAAAVGIPARCVSRESA